MDVTQEVFHFITNYWGEIYQSKQSSDTTLSDLGFYGDDKKEFMESFFTKYGIEGSSFNHQKYIEPEYNYWWPFLRGLFFKIKRPDVLEIKISDLANALVTKKWQD